jgi:hypothetical protein
MVANYNQPQVFRRLQLKEEGATIKKQSLKCPGAFKEEEAVCSLK